MHSININPNLYDQRLPYTELFCQTIPYLAVFAHINLPFNPGRGHFKGSTRSYSGHYMLNCFMKEKSSRRVRLFGILFVKLFSILLSLVIYCLWQDYLMGLRWPPKGLLTRGNCVLKSMREVRAVLIIPRLINFKKDFFPCAWLCQNIPMNLCFILRFVWNILAYLELFNGRKKLFLEVAFPPVLLVQQHWSFKNAT